MVRIFITITLSKGWFLHQLYKNNAFLNDALTEEVYIFQSIGFEDVKNILNMLTGFKRPSIVLNKPQELGFIP